MSMGDDIKETLVFGTAYTILRTPTNIIGEYADISINAQVTKPFIREFFLEGTFAYDTQVVSGDYLQFPDGRFFIVMNKTPETFENTVISYSCVLYRCNVVGTIQRQSNDRSETSLAITQTWSSVTTGVRALVTEAMYENDLGTEEGYGQYDKTKMDMYLPVSVGIQEHDRFYVSVSEYYKVENIMRRRFEGVHLVTLREDNR